jgi:hypothetical protein
MRGILLWLLFFPVLSFAQDSQLLKKYGDIEIKYRVRKVKDSGKKSDYIVDFTYVNTSPKDKYYAVLPGKNDDDSARNDFAYTDAENVTNLLSQHSGNFVGQKTTLAVNGTNIFVLKAGVEYETLMEFTLKNEYVPSIVFKGNKEVVFKESVLEYL